MDRLYWFLALIAVTVAKTLILQHKMGLLASPGLLVICTVPLFALLYTSVLLWGRRGLTVGIAVNTLISLVYLADLLHFRYSGTPLPIGAVRLWRQARAVADSITALLRSADLVLFLDTAVLMLAAAVYRTRSQKAYKSLPTKALLACILAVVVSLVPVWNVVHTKGANYGLAHYGVITYHLYDIYNHLQEQGIELEPELREVYQEKQSYYKYKSSQFFGLARGRNVIVIQVEAMQDFVINRTVLGQEITPFLNSLIQNDSIYSSKYFQMLGRGNTADAEFVSHNSLHPDLEQAAYEKYVGKRFYSLPLVMRQHGYTTLAFHGNVPSFWNRGTIYPQQGFDAFYSSEELVMDEQIGMGLSDGSLFRQVVQVLQQQKQPFYAFVVTLSSHHPFQLPPQYQKLKIPARFQGSLVGDYLQAMHYVDSVLEHFVEELKANGLYQDSVIAIYGDHFGLSVADAQVRKDASDLLGYSYDYDEMLNVPLIIHIPDWGSTHEIEITGGQIDFFPTMLNLLGIKKHPDAVMLGRDLLNADKGFVPMKAYIIEGSFIDDEKIFVMSRDGVFENSRAWMLQDKRPVAPDQCRELSQKAVWEMRLSEWLLDNNMVLRKLK